MQLQQRAQDAPTAAKGKGKGLSTSMEEDNSADEDSDDDEDLGDEFSDWRARTL